MNPLIFQEFGPARPPGPHVFIGFHEPTNTFTAGGATIKEQLPISIIPAHLSLHSTLEHRLVDAGSV